MTYEESLYLDKIIESEYINSLSKEYSKQLFIYDLNPLLIFKPSVWDKGFIFKLLDSGQSDIIYNYENTINDFIIELIIDSIDKRRLYYYYTNPLNFINRVVSYIHEDKNVVLYGPGDSFKSNEINYKLKHYLKMFAYRFHLLTNNMFKEQTSLKSQSLSIQPEHYNSELYIKDKIIDTAGHTGVIKIITYKITRR